MNALYNHTTTLIFFFTTMNLITPITFTILLTFCYVSLAKKNTYIVHMATHRIPASFQNNHTHWFHSSLHSVSESANMIYTYHNVIHGFSTKLSAQQAKSLKNLPGVLSVLPEMRYELHITRTPEFLGLEQNNNLLPQSSGEGDVVIGILDTGVWPESKSFDDTGMGPVPHAWKGACETGTNFTVFNCNRKLIGARFFASGYEATVGPIDEAKENRSPRDDDGHGTHTSTTIGGSVVVGANLLGYAAGVARGMAPRARVAVYKVCWMGGCFSSDILAGMDKAIADSVNVLSLSLGGGSAEFYRDSVAIGAFAAMEKGIFVSCSAGNAGPASYTLSNVSPWITTVGAGTLDRDFPAYVSLGNGKNYSGVSLYRGPALSNTMLPIVYAGKVSSSTSGALCMPGSLIPDMVKGKIVLCDRGINSRVQKGSVVKEAGASGMVLTNTAANGEELVADAHLLPATLVGLKAGDEIRKYVTSDSNPTATILFEGTKLGIQSSPMVAAFSSRGPNTITPEILKPDILAPGVNILAGWSGSVGPTGLSEDTRRVEFNIISGTSMSCPHVSGLAALLKSAHPDWSPAAVKSALMTTAYTTYKNGKMIEDLATGNPSTPFDHGAGHVDPVSALEPGLVYDITADDYFDFLCALNYTTTQIQLITKRNTTCDSTKTYSVGNLNYPSFAVVVPLDSAGKSGATTVINHTRTLTNVGPASSTYKVSTYSGSNSVGITVVPETLTFSQVNEKKVYTVVFTAGAMMVNSNVFGRIEWSDGKHVVGSPVVVSW
ncbi:putative cucumisin [Helianthus debilis subsp. tardiflorus]